ncbi:sigma-70 family RNA polymerase sigma factor [Sphingomonas populi]|uniref:Sigma-70 family RNA polymerase sigma factor n=1 Tax=Sphingomonas populi TaxID=2484750 RepID=A0A4V2DBU6_9SPHN|nr:sigma-70 family RNA polymerase sigma factor [Sphingomonas populi]
MTSAELVGWVGRYILPHEARLRSWLRSAFPAIDVDDVVQEAYCRIATLERVSHIEDPRQYLFKTARNIVLEQLRRDRIVSIEAATGLAEMDQAADGEHGNPERLASDRRMLARVEQLIAMLPERGRQVFRMRKIEGLSQRDISAQLGLSESVVENEISRSLDKIVRALTQEERAELPLHARGRRHGKVRHRVQD